MSRQSSHISFAVAKLCGHKSKWHVLSGPCSVTLSPDSLFQLWYCPLLMPRCQGLGKESRRKGGWLRIGRCRLVRLMPQMLTAAKGLCKDVPTHSPLRGRMPHMQ